MTWIAGGLRRGGERRREGGRRGEREKRREEKKILRTLSLLSCGIRCSMIAFLSCVGMVVLYYLKEVIFFYFFLLWSFSKSCFE